MLEVDGLLLKEPYSLTDEALRILTNVLDDLRYGSVELVVHDGRIVQVDRVEKIRFDKTARL